MTTKEAAQGSLSPPGPKTETSVSNSRSCVDPEQWVQEYGDMLFGFAALRVRDRVIAQDLPSSICESVVAIFQPITGNLATNSAYFPA
jgi:hypothetical protein